MLKQRIRQHSQGLLAPGQDLWRRDYHYRLLLRDIHVPYVLVSHQRLKTWLTRIGAAATIDYLDSGKIKTKGIVNKTFKLEDFDKALQSIKDKSAIKAAIVFD